MALQGRIAASRWGCHAALCIMAYGFAILPNLVLLIGTALVAAGSDGQMQPSAHVWQSVMEYTLTGWAFLFMAIPLLMGRYRPASGSPAGTARASPLLETGGGGLLGGNRGGGECGVFIILQANFCGLPGNVQMCKCAAQIFSHTRARKIIRWKSHNCGVDVPDKQSLCWLEVSWPSFRSPICRHAMHILSFLPASELSRYSGSDRVSFFLPPV